MKAINRNKLIYLVSFLTPVILLTVSFVIVGFAPFGSKSMLIMDMSDQYIEFYSGLKDIILGDSSIFYSWKMGFGENIIGLFAYYLSSPFTFITLFFDKSNIIYSIVVLTLLKTGLSGLTFSFYINKRYNLNSVFKVLLFSLSYSLMSYNIAYSMCLMWLDSVIWLPIVIYALEYMIDKKKCLPLILMLFVVFVSNYYTAYMVGAFSFIYLLYYVVSNNKKNLLRHILNLVGSAAAAGGLSAFLIVPTAMCMLSGKIGGNNYSPDSIINFNPFILIYKSFFGSYDGITNSGTPFVYFGVALIVLVLAFFAAKSISLRNRVSAAAVFSVIIISFVFTKLDILWHCMQYPNWFPYRYSFVYVFFALTIACRGFLALENISLKLSLTIFTSAVLVYVISAAFFCEEISILVITLAILTASVVLVWIIKLNPQVKRVITLIFAVVISLELTLNSTVIFNNLDKDFGYKSVESYVNYTNHLTDITDKIKTTDKTFYRMDKTFERSKNDAFGNGYNGITHYSSAYNRNTNSFLKSLGFAQYYIWSSYYGSTPITDSLFSVKYILSDREVFSEYELKYKNNNYAAYQNPYVLSPAYVSSEKISQYTPTADPFLNQQNILNAVSGYEYEYFSKVQNIDMQFDNCRIDTNAGYLDFIAEDSDYRSSVNFSFICDKASPVYAYFPTDEVNNADISVNGVDLGSAMTTETNKIFYLGDFAKGEKLSLTIAFYNKRLRISDYIFYFFNNDLFEKSIGKIKSNELNITDFNDTYIKGTISAQTDTKLMTTITADTGWHMYIDGKKAEWDTFCGTLICSDLPYGEHVIEFKYIPKGLISGIAISAATALILIGYVLYKNKHKIGKKIIKT